MRIQTAPLATRSDSLSVMTALFGVLPMRLQHESQPHLRISLARCPPPLPGRARGGGGGGWRLTVNQSCTQTSGVCYIGISTGFNLIRGTQVPSSSRLDVLSAQAPQRGCWLVPLLVLLSAGGVVAERLNTWTEVRMPCCSQRLPSNARFGECLMALPLHGAGTARWPPGA